MGDEQTLWACVAAAQERFQHVDSYALYPDALPVLQTLSARGLTLGVVSDWGVGLSLILRHHDLLRYFDFAVISASLRLAKPDPALFETALRRAVSTTPCISAIRISWTCWGRGPPVSRRCCWTAVALCHRPDVDCLVVRDLYGLLDVLGIARPA